MLYLLNLKIYNKTTSYLSLYCSKPSVIRPINPSCINQEKLLFYSIIKLISNCIKLVVSVFLVINIHSNIKFAQT